MSLLSLFFFLRLPKFTVVLIFFLRVLKTTQTGVSNEKDDRIVEIAARASRNRSDEECGGYRSDDRRPEPLAGSQTCISKE